MGVVDYLAISLIEAYVYDRYEDVLSPHQQATIRFAYWKLPGYSLFKENGEFRDPLDCTP